MDTLTHLLGGLFSTVLAGGATGLAGVALQQFFGWLNAKAQLALVQANQAHELAMRDKDAAIMREEWAGRTKVAQTEGDAAKDVAASQAFAATMWKEPERYTNAATLTPAQQWLMVLLDVTRGIVRPLLTLYLCALTTYVWWQVRQLVAKEDLQPAEVLALWRLVVETILYLTTTVVLWWFGTRNTQAAPAVVQSKVTAPAAAT